MKKECILSEEKHTKCQMYKPMNDLKKFNTIKANKLCVIIVFKEIILRQNANEKTHLSKVIVLQSIIQSFRNISLQIKEIEVRKEERKILNKIQTSKGKRTKFSHLQA